PTHFLEHLADTHDADVILATHTGIKWHRHLSPFPHAEGAHSSPLPRGERGRGEGLDRHFINVGVLGRPENDGRTNVWYTILEVRPEIAVDFVPVEYNHERLAREMGGEKLPEEFVETILTGWWTTCLEVLPAKERRRGSF